MFFSDKQQILVKVVPRKVGCNLYCPKSFLNTFYLILVDKCFKLHLVAVHPETPYGLQVGIVVGLQIHFDWPLGLHIFNAYKVCIFIQYNSILIIKYKFFT